MSERLTDERLRAWVARVPPKVIEDAIRRLLDENAALRDERDALRAEAGRLRSVLEKALAAFRASEPQPWDGFPWDDILEALSSAPLSAAVLDRWKAMERVVEYAVTRHAEMQRIMREHGFVIDLDEPWQKLAFTFYTELVELAEKAEAALDRTEEGRRRVSA